MDILTNLPKSKREEIRKKVKEFMAADGINYDDWLFEMELNYLLNNVGNLQKKKPGGIN